MTLRGRLGDIWATCEWPWDPKGGPLKVQARFFMNSGSHLGGLRTSFFLENRFMDLPFAVDVYGMVPGMVLNEILMVQGGFDS